MSKQYNVCVYDRWLHKELKGTFKARTPKRAMQVAQELFASMLGDFPENMIITKVEEVK